MRASSGSFLLRQWLVPYGLAGLVIGLFLFSSSERPEISILFASIPITLFISGLSMLGSALFARSVCSSVTGALFGTLIAAMILHAGVALTAGPPDIIDILTGLYIPSFLLTGLAIFLSLHFQRDEIPAAPKARTNELAIQGSYTVRDALAGEIEIDLREIVWIGTSRNRVILHTLSGGYAVSGPLKDVLAKMPDDFIRVHKQFAVRRDQIVSKRRVYGQLYVRLSDGEELPVGRRFLSELRLL